VTFYAKGPSSSTRTTPSSTLDYARGQEYIIGTKQSDHQRWPSTASTAQLPSTSKWYPGGSGGVPAVPA
jgi:iron complex outermembrane receptor protein